MIKMRIEFNALRYLIICELDYRLTPIEIWNKLKRETTPFSFTQWIWELCTHQSACLLKRVKTTSTVPRKKNYNDNKSRIWVGFDLDGIQYNVKAAVATTAATISVQKKNNVE